MPEPLPATAPPLPRPSGSWWAKFACAFRGIGVAAAGHSSFRVHFLAAVAVIAAGAVLQINLVEWCILTGCVFAVLTSEMVNSSLEMLVRGTASGPRTEYRDALDMAAGAVLLASAGAAIVGGLVLGNAILSRLM